MKTETNLPNRIAKLPEDDKGRPVPFFVQWIDGKPDFRIMDASKFARCHNEGLCWVCGEKLGRFKAFLIGPMCAVNKVSSEPPSHLECATFSAQACPFLTTPAMHRRERDLPEEGLSCIGGIAIKRNPGVALVWVTKSYRLEKDGNGGYVFRIGPPESCHWYCEGRAATRQEILDSMESGLPILQEMAEADGPLAVKMLNKGLAEAMQLLPA